MGTASQPEERSSHLCLHLAWVLLLWGLIYLPGMFHPALLDDADSVNAQVGREMAASSDWVTPTANGVRYLEKPPLLLWLMVPAYRTFGATDWAARVPLVLAVLTLVLVVYWFSRRTFGESSALYSAVIYLTAFGPYLLTRILIPDFLIGLWLLLSFIFFLLSLEGERPSLLACWGLAAASALNVLTKGLIGLVFPAGTIVLYLLLTGNLRHLLRLRLISSSIVFLVIASPWHILAAIRNPDQPEIRGFLWFYFINEHIMRFLNKRIPHDYVTVPLWLFLGLVLLWMIPWTGFLFPALKQIPRRISEIRAGLDARGRTLLVLGLWPAVILGFFLFSTRQEYYTLPLLPALAMLTGVWLAREAGAPAGSAIRVSGQRVMGITFAISGVAGAMALALGALAKPVPAGADVADLMAKNPEEYIYSLGHFLDLTPAVLGAFRGPLFGTGAALLLGTGFGWYFRRRGRMGLANAALAIMMVAFLYCAHLGLMVYEPVLSSRDLARSIERAWKPGEIIVLHGEYEFGSTLNFYTGRQVRILNGRNANLWYGSYYADAPRIFLDNAAFAQLWQGSERVYVFTEIEQSRKAMIGIDSKSVYELARRGGKMILTNRPVY